MDARRRAGLGLSGLVVVASLGGLAYLRLRRPDDTTVHVLAREARIDVGPFAFVVGKDGHELSLRGPGDVAILGGRIDVGVGDAPGDLRVRGVRPAKGRAVELDVDVVLATETVAGVVRISPRRKPAGLEIAWVGPRPASGPMGVLLAFETLDQPPVVAGALELVGQREAPYALVPLTSGLVSVGPGHVAWGGGPPFWLRARAEGVLSLSLGAADEVAEAALRRVSVPSRRLHGSTSPKVAGAIVVALDERGVPSTAARTGGDGTFSLAVPPNARLRAQAGGLSLGDPVDAADVVVVPAAPLGRLSVSVRDHDLHVPLPSRIVVHGIDGAREPNFGAPHRAGAGPLVDTEDGLFSTLLPAGRYRVLAERGPEYTVDRRDVDIPAGGAVVLPLALRHVVDTPGLAACDLHVHSRGSFDSTVSLEDRVRSLMAQGIDFAAASEHNRTGTYASAAFASATTWMSWASSVEVTTTNPLRGHFNVIPWTAASVPRHQRTTLEALVHEVRRDSPDSLVQVNHPRLGHGIGHFHTIHLDEATGKGLSRLARGFDTLEVYNGFDLPTRARVEEVLKDWLHLLEAKRDHWATGNSDSHAVQYVAAGWPRTYVSVASDHEDGRGPPVDVTALVAALKKGHAFVTSGPMVELSQGAAQPGDALVVEGGRAKVHVRVRVAPWIDASELEIRVGGKTALVKRIAAREIEVGTPQGTLEEARRNTIVLDEDLEVEVPAGARSLVAIVRGDRLVGTVLPFMDFAPMAFSNPLLVPIP